VGDHHIRTTKSTYRSLSAQRLSKRTVLPIFIFFVSKFMCNCDYFHFLQTLTFFIFTGAFVKTRNRRQLTVYRKVQIAVQHFHAVKQWQSRKQGKNSTARHFEFGPLKLHKRWCIPLVWFNSGHCMIRYCDHNLLQGWSIPWITWSKTLFLLSLIG
jgi:hypothetical protein